MDNFRTEEEVIFWIENIKRFSKRTSLDRIRKALKALGNPLKNTKKIHIGGTNGKGSTANFIASILRENGLKTGLFISPYIIKFNERISINNDFITAEELIRLGNILYNLAEEFKRNEEIITFFEILTLLAFLYFAEKNVDVAVIEVGLGGLLDATNVYEYDLSVITNIGYDHMAQLGNTLEEIALNKLGIVKKNNHLITAVDKNLRDLFINYTEKLPAKVSFLLEEDLEILEIMPVKMIFQNKEYHLSMHGYHQAYNASLAIMAVNSLYSFPQEKINAGLKKMFWPGRLEIVNNDPLIILDGAHNIHGIKSLAKTISALNKSSDIAIVFCVMHDKDYLAMLKELRNVSDFIILTQIDYKRSLHTDELEEEILELVDKVIETPLTAYNEVKKLKDKTIIFTGSLYFISEIRKIIK